VPFIQAYFTNVWSDKNSTFVLTLSNFSKYGSRGAVCHCFVCPSKLYILNLLWEIDIVDKLGLIGTWRLSRLILKIQKHPISTFLHTWSSHFTRNWTYTLPGTKVTQDHFWKVKVTQCLYLIWEKNYRYFNCLNRYLIIHYRIGIKPMSFRQWSLNVIFKTSR
jgi:hypothetical protein